MGTIEKLGYGTLIYTTDYPLTCLAVNYKADLIAVAGRNVFQVLSVHPDKFVQLPRSKPNTRLNIETNETSNSSRSTDAVVFSPTESSSVLPLSEVPSAPRSHIVTDVSWSCVGDILATGSSNGSISLWDVKSSILHQKCFTAHARSIHCLNFHPSNPWELISASQDGKLKQFDTREADPGANARTLVQRGTSSSPVRDVVYRPHHANHLAAAQENGSVSIWDTRMPNKPYWTFQAHSCSVSTLDWHPDLESTSRNYLATAGTVDHLIKVWNITSSLQSNISSPANVYTIRTNNASRVRWRPGFPTQLVSSCNQTFDLSIYLWDLERPFMPYASFEHHKCIVTSISWSPTEPDYFQTVGRDGLLIRNCIADGLRPSEYTSPVALSFSARGFLTHAVGKHRVRSTGTLTSSDQFNMITQSPFYSAHRTSSTNLVGLKQPQAPQSSQKVSPNLTTSRADSQVTLMQTPTERLPTPSAVINEGSSKTTAPTESSHPASDQRGGLDKQSFTISGGSSGGTSSTSIPILGSSLASAMFVAQKHALTYFFEPNISTEYTSDWMNSSSALSPSLIMSLAEHYEFAGPSVNSVCGHNAAIAIRFGQSFLMQFWSLLRALYGFTQTSKRKFSLPTTTTMKKSFVKFYPNLSTVSASTKLQPVMRRTSSSGHRNTRFESESPMDPTKSSGVVNLHKVLRSVGLNAITAGMLVNQVEVPVSDVGQASFISGDVIYRRHSCAGIDNKPNDLLNKTVGRKTSSSSSNRSQEAPDRLHTTTDIEPPPIPGLDRSADIVFKAVMTNQTCSSPSGIMSTSISSTHTGDSGPTDFLFRYSPTHADSEEMDDAFSGGVEQADFGTSKHHHLQEPGLTQGTSYSDVPFIPDDAFPLEPPLGQYLYASPIMADLTKTTGMTHIRPSTSSGRNILDHMGQLVVNASSAGMHDPLRDTTSNGRTESVQLLAPFNAAIGLPRHGFDPQLLADIGTGQPHQLQPEPDMTPLIVPWFMELIDSGHVQTVCTALLMLGRERVRLTDWVSEERIENWFTAYIDLLSRYRLWTVIARIIKQCSSNFSGIDTWHQVHSIRPLTIANRHLDTETDHKLEFIPPSQTRSKGISAASSTAAMMPMNIPAPIHTKALAPDVSGTNQISTTLNIHCGRCSKRFAAAESTQRITGHTGWACSRHTTTADGVTATCALCHLTVRGLFIWCRGCSHGGHLEHMQEWLSHRSDCPAGCGHHCEYG